ncbi:hypothetical protein EVAR_28118_1 [Eumeta japonica]|uniref:Uncharacterized protein n=1 Tax=Eumeta variegata TaxID=151549 RepID=A0A4C1VEW0_EUMVA|nr:hypothetical protein EVAR_28118_1 [Eumeta japonica]
MTSATGLLPPPPRVSPLPRAFRRQTFHYIIIILNAIIHIVGIKVHAATTEQCCGRATATVVKEPRPGWIAVPPPPAWS